MKIWSKSIKTIKKIITKPVDALILEKAKKLKSLFFVRNNNPISVFMVLVSEVKSNINSKSNIYTRTRYTLQKQSAAYSSPIRVICKFFIVYIFGSFCWFACNTSKYSGIALAFSDTCHAYGTQSKKQAKEQKQATFNSEYFINFFHEVFADIANLPLLKGTDELQSKYTAETVENILFKERKSSYLKKGLINKTTVNGTNVNLKMSPFWHEFSTQNFVGKTPTLKPKEKEAEILLFARKPLLLAKQKISKNQEKNIFLNKDKILLIDPNIYSGTSLVIGPKSDLLPRKLESVYNKFTVKSVFNVLGSCEATACFAESKKVKKKPQLYPVGVFVWAKDLSMILSTDLNRLNASSATCFAKEAKVLGKPEKISKEFTVKTGPINKDSFYEPRLQSGFNYPDIPLRKNCKPEVAIQVKKKSSPFASFAKQRAEEAVASQKINQIKYNVPTASTFSSQFTELLVPFGSGLQSKNQSQYQHKLQQEVGLMVVPSDTTSSWKKYKKKSRTFASPLLNLPLAKQAKQKVSRTSLKNPFLEFIYKPDNLEGYISYKKPEGLMTLRKKSFISRLPLRTPTQFVALDKTADIRTSHDSVKDFIFENKKDLSCSFWSCRKAPPRSRRSVANVSSAIQLFCEASSKKQAKAPESFFGENLLQLGERFTLEKLQGNRQMGILYSIHTGDPYAPVQELAGPYISTGASLRTVFGKIKVRKPGVNLSKNINPDKLITNYRTVTNWAVTTPSTSFQKSWLEKSLIKDRSWQSYNKEDIKDKGFTLQEDESSKNFFRRLFYFNRLEGKTNKNLENPFLCYKPTDPRSDGVVGETLVRIVKYKKSLLFPQMHAFHRGTAFTSLPAKWEQCKKYTDQDIEIQSILGGMRQETLAVAKQNKQKKQKKKFRSTACYPLRTLFTVSPQEAMPGFSLGPTDIGEYNYIGLSDTYSGGRKSPSFAKNIQGNVYTKGFYLERVNNSPFEGSALSSIESNSWTSVSKLVFFAYGWYGYKLLATALNKSTRLLPVGFTDAIGLQTIQEKFRIIRQSKTKQSFRNLAGAEKTLSELRDLIWTFRLGTGTFSSKKSRNRFLLVGPPGTGKTLLVKALAAEANVPVIVQPASQLRMISGVENPVSTLFHLARQIKPCILFLDELDTLGSAIDTVTTGFASGLAEQAKEATTAEQVKAIRLARKYTYTLLLELDGLTSSTNDLLIIGATNRPETLNPALTRAGRFDTVINCNLPSQEQRLAVLSLYLNKQRILPLKKLNTISHKTIEQANLNSYLAQKCFGLSQASIATVVNESALESMLHRGRPVHTLETLERAIESVRILTAKLTNYSAFSFARPSTTLNSYKAKKRVVLHASQNKQKQQSSPCKTKHCSDKNSDWGKQSLTITQQLSLFSAYETAGSVLFTHKLSVIKEGAKNSISRISQLDRKNLEVDLLKVYAGKAAASIYSATRPQIFKLAARSGLYTNPTVVGELMLQISDLTDRSCFLSPVCVGDRAKGKPLAGSFAVGHKQKQSQGSSFLEEATDSSRGEQKKEERSLVLSKQNIKLTRFISETSITKQGIYSASAYPENSVGMHNRKSNLQPRLSSQQDKGLGFAKQVLSSKAHHKQLSRTTKLSTPVTTRWFRVYLDRPFFRYDSLEFIENPEYYPKNDYLVVSSKTRQPFFQNVSTRRFVKQVVQSKANLKKISLSDGLPTFSFALGSYASFAYKAKQIVKVAKIAKEAPLNAVETVNNCSEAQQYQGIEGKSFQQKDFSNVSKESLYLAIVAMAFHKASIVVQEHRELLDYCVYKTLRHGVLYEFSLNEICEKF